MSTMLVFFSGEADVSIGTVATSLRSVPEKGRVDVVSPEHLIVWDGSWPIHVAYMGAPDLAQEARESEAAPALAAYNKWFEVSYEPDIEMNHFNTWLIVIHSVGELVEGVVFDPESGEVFDPRSGEILGP